MKYIKKNDGSVYMDAHGFQSLKEEQTIFCYNEEEKKCNILEFFCCTCNRGLKGLKACETHWTTSKHKKNVNGYMSKIKHCKRLRNLTSAEDSELSKFLMKTSEERLINETNFVERLMVCKDVEETIKSSGVFDVSCQLYGSSSSGVGFKDSNVNIDITYDIEKISKIIPHITDAPLLLLYIHGVLKDSDKFCDVADSFHDSISKFSFTHVKSGLHCMVCPYFNNGTKTSLLIRDYMCLDKRVKHLCIAFRQWAMVCGLDDPEGGSLSPYCFTIMMIHYLQQVNPPVLPVINLHIQENLPPGMRKRNKNMINIDQIVSWKSSNKLSIGKLWVGLFKYYFVDFFFKSLVVSITQHAPMTKQLRGLYSRKISIEDPFFAKDNVANTLASSEVMDYFTSCLEKSYVYYSLCPPIERGAKNMDNSANKDATNTDHKKLKGEKRRSGESPADKKENNKKEKKDDDKLSSDNVETTKNAKGREHSKKETKNVKKKNEAQIKNVISDVLCQPEVGDLQFPDTDSDNDDTNSPDKNDDVEIEFRDSQQDFDFDHVNSKVASGNSCDGDDDLPNENENSDVEIEEEYFENKYGDLQKVCRGLRNNQETNEVMSNKKHPLNKTDMVSTDVDVINDKSIKSDDDLQPKHISSNDDACSSPHEESVLCASHLDSFTDYDGDVDSQVEDDAKPIKIESGEDEGNVFSDTGVDEVIQASCDTDQNEDNEQDLHDVKNKEIEIEAQLEVNQSQNDSSNPLSATILDSVLDVDLTKAAEILPNMEKLSIEEPEPVQGGGGDTVKMENLIEDVHLEKKDPQVDITRNEPSPSVEQNKVQHEPIMQQKSDIIKELSDEVVNIILQGEDDDVDKVDDLKKSDSNKIEKFSGKYPVSPKFCFQRQFLAPIPNVPLFCKICNQDGHRSSECGLMYAKKLVTLQPLTKTALELVDRMCENVLKDNELSFAELEDRRGILQEMERHLKKYFKESCRLALFGSSINNFGFRGSDLDICMRFESDDPPIGLHHPTMVVKIARALDKHDAFNKVMYIKSAKVPIVKFVIKNLNLEGDISLYNCLALKNSLMLKAYASIDIRVRILGYCIKVFAKICEIGDASRGSLSSYAYTLLTLFYLQRTEPPVIPILQQLHDHSKAKPVSMVEGWNTWYYSDIRRLETVWPGYGKNHQSIGDLFLGFFRFYVEKFDFGRNVVAIKQIKKLSKFQKGWTHSTMSIEDPFNLTHNLAGGITRNMFAYIFSCFQNARVHFGTSHKNLKKNSSNGVVLKFLFNRNNLTENRDVPKDRLCYRCGRIGHTSSNCAEKVVADRDRRRHDSERTYSSENGDSDSNVKSKGRTLEDVKCYGCGTLGHIAANCPSKGRNKPPRDRRDSDRKEQMKKSSPLTKGHPTGVQAASDVHPMDNFNVVLPKSEMTTKFKPEPERDSKQSTGKKLREKGEEIDGVNTLFANPERFLASKESEGHVFSNHTINELNLLQGSVKGVSFLQQTTPHNPENTSQSPKPLKSPSKTSSPNKSQRRRTSPLKPNNRGDRVAKHSNKNPPIPQSDSHAVSVAPGDLHHKNKIKHSFNLSVDSKSMGLSGFQPISGEIQGNTAWTNKSPDFKSIGFEAATNNAGSPGYQQYHHSKTTHNHIRNIPFHSNSGNDKMAHRNGPMMNQTQHTQGININHAQTLSSSAPGNYGKFHYMPPTRGKNGSFNPGEIPPQYHWLQAPTPGPGYVPVNHHGEPKTEHSPSSFTFEGFRQQFEMANSPPKGGYPSNSPEKGADIIRANLPMKYDEEYPSPKSKNHSPNKNRKKREKKDRS